MKKNNIILAICNDSYYRKHNSYPEEFQRTYAKEYYEFDTPEELIDKWCELDEGIWYWVLVNNQIICSGALDPDDIEILEDYFNISMED